MKLSEGERIRLAHAVSRLKATVKAMEIVLRTPGVPTDDAGQSLVQVAVEISNLLAKINAYERAELVGAEVTK